jgi:hypothetical protein
VGNLPAYSTTAFSTDGAPTLSPIVEIRSSSPTRMRTPPVKRHTLPRSGFVLFFRFPGPGAVSRQCRVLTSLLCAGTNRCGCTKHLLRRYRPLGSDGRALVGSSLRPSNAAVPSYRPRQRDGCASTARQFGSGSGEGPHTSPGRLSPYVQEPERVSHHSRGLWEKRPLHTLACSDAVHQGGEDARSRPCGASEASGARALLPDPWRNVSLVKAT